MSYSIASSSFYSRILPPNLVIYTVRPIHLLCLLTFLGADAVAIGGNAVKHKAFPILEELDNQDPPARVWRTSSTPRMISTHGAFTSYQVNVGANGMNIFGDAANEPSITIDPSNPKRMSIGWRQFDFVESNFRKGGFAYTTNGGLDWIFPGNLTQGFRSDPVLIADSTGRFFYLSLVPNFYDDIWRSDSGGQSWTQLAPATGGDKQWFTIDTTNSSGHGFQYQSWSSAGNNWGGRQFTRSTDGGFSWLDPIDIPNSPSWGTLDVDSNGVLYLCGVNFDSFVFWCIRSSDAKNPAVIPSFDQATEVEMGGYPVYGGGINPEGLAGQSFLVVDRSGSASNNKVYMLASLQGYDAPDGTDVVFVRSTDHGQTFGAPRRINDDPVNPNKWHWLGTLAVAPNGRIDVVWLDSRNAANNTDSQLFYSYSADGGVNWSPNVAVSESFNPFLGYPNQEKMGDYITIVSDSGGGNVAYCATLNGEEDIYYVRVTPDAVTSSLPLFVVSSTKREVSGSVSVTFHSQTGKTYRCDYSDRPAGPWSELQANIVGTNEDISIHDPGASGKVTRFYRIVALP